MIQVEKDALRGINVIAMLVAVIASVVSVMTGSQVILGVTCVMMGVNLSMACLLQWGRKVHV